MTDHQQQLATMKEAFKGTSTFARMAYVYSLLSKLLNGEFKNTRFAATGMMDVVVEVIVPHYGLPTYSIASYGQLNGDLMRDPDIELLEIDIDGEKALLPLSFRNDYLGLWQTTVGEGGHVVTPLVDSILEYLIATWLPQIKESYQVVPFRQKL